MAALAESAEAMAREAAGRRLAAHARCEEAEGAGRAVALARRGGPWSPFDLRAEERAVFGDAPGVG